MNLIDSHAHIDVTDFDADRDAMLARAGTAGVEMLLAIGNGPEVEKLGAAIPYAEQHDWIYAAAGLHPHEAKHATEAHYAELARLAEHPRFIAWGEIGLDYHFDHSPRDVQAEVFLRQLQQARSAGIPVVIHCRDAWEDCLQILRTEWASSGLRGIFHCFTGTLEEAQRGIEMGFLVSFAGNLTYPKSENLREVARQLPMETLLIETDSPFLSPQGYRGKRNEPARVAEVARTIASVRNLAVTEVATSASQNFCKLFHLLQPSAGTVEIPGGTPSHF